MIKLFLSSVSRDFTAVRQAIVDDLKTAQYAILNMESFGAQPERSLEVCLRELRTADVVAVIVGPRYGSIIPGGDVSFTHEEFREAQRRGIPVLAFVLDPSPDCDKEEKDRLLKFAEEAGGAVMYQKTKKGQLSAKILASLTGARERGDVGLRYKLFQPWDLFFAQQLRAGDGLHSHSQFVGRQREIDLLKDFVKSRDPVMVVVAPGGIGKSRLLLEWARQTTAEASTKVLFVDAGASWDADDINSLPVVPTLLVVDDAHRRPELDRLIAAAVKVNPKIRFVVSCRPGAIDVLLPHLSDLVAAGEPRSQITLAPLQKKPSLELARGVLGEEFEHLAEQLVRIADGNPLVIAVGGRCIGANNVGPDLLDHTPEQFRTQVLDRLLLDPALDERSAQTRKKILESLAAIGPVNTEDMPTRQLWAKLLELAPSKLVCELAHLEYAGFIQRRARLVRVTPDVLSDHLLYRAAVDRNGKPTGYVDEVLAHFGVTFLGNVLANAAELDWRAVATDRHDPVLDATWRALERALPAMTHRQRNDLLAQLKRAAVFQPDPVLKLVEWICDHPEAPKDADLERLGIDESPARALDAACDLLGFIATHPDFTTRCIPRLWAFAEADDRPTNPNPEHPRRRLGDLLKYDRNVHPEVQLQTLRCVIEHLNAPSRTAAVPWAVESLSAVLARSGEANSATKRAFTMGSFPLAPHLPQIAERREQAITCLTDLAMGDRPTEAASAIDRLGHLLTRPHGLFGRQVTDVEVTAWLPESKRVAESLVAIYDKAKPLVIRYLARRELRKKSRERWPDLGTHLDDLLRQFPALAEEPFFDILAGAPREDQLKDWKDEKLRLRNCCTAAAQVLWSAHQTASDVASMLVQAIQHLGDVLKTNSVNVWELVGALVETKPTAAVDLVRSLAAYDTENAFRLVPAVLAALVRIGDVKQMVMLVRELQQSRHEALRAYTADALRFLIGNKGTTAEQLDLVLPFLADPSAVVQEAAIRPLAGFADAAPTAALHALVSVEWKGNLSRAATVCDVLNAQYGLDPEQLTDPQIDRILAQIETLQVLEGRLHDFLEFIAFASKRRPRGTVDMLIRRVKACASHRGARGHDQWTPIPYNGRGLSLPGLMNSPDYHELLRSIRELALDDDLIVRFWVPELFHVAVPDLAASQVGQAVLLEWIDSRNADQIIATAHLLRGFDRAIVFSLAEFIAQILEAAAAKGDDCLRRSKSELYGVAVSGTYERTPGQPAQRHVSDKQSASAMAEQFRERTPVREFFEELVRHAEESIRRELAEFDEEEEE